MASTTKVEKVEHSKRFEQISLREVSKEDLVKYNLVKYRSKGSEWVTVQEYALNKGISWVQLVVELMSISASRYQSLVDWERALAKNRITGDEIRLHEFVNGRTNLKIREFDRDIKLSITSEAKELVKVVNMLTNFTGFDIEIFMEDPENSSNNFDELDTDEEIVSIEQLKDKKCHIMMIKASGVIMYAHSLEVVAVIVSKLNQSKELINMRVNNTYFVDKEDSKTAKINDKLFLKTDHNKKDIINLVSMIDSDVLLKVYNYNTDTIKKEWEI